MYDFLTITNSNKPASYGGSQSWFREKSGKSGGCGSVAAANALACLAKANPRLQKAFGLQFEKDGSLSKKSFFPFQEDIFSHLGTWRLPKPVGIGIWRYTRRTLRFAVGKDVFLKPRVLVTTCASDYEKPLDFIRRGLKASGAVTLLTSWNRFSDISKHFITITGIEKNPRAGTVLTVSTWGKKKVYSYDEIWQSWQSPRSFGTALVYFTPALNPQITKTCVRRSYRLPVVSACRVFLYFFHSFITK